MKRVLAGVAFAALVFVGSAAVVQAGEIKGCAVNTDRCEENAETPIKAQQSFPDDPAGPANSFCAFSGLNDDPDDPEHGDGKRTQSWGTEVVKVLEEDGAEAVVLYATEVGLNEVGPGTECQGGFPTLGAH